MKAPLAWLHLCMAFVCIAGATLFTVQSIAEEMFLQQLPGDLLLLVNAGAKIFFYLKTKP